MKKTEEKYVDSYKRPGGCLAVAAAFFLIVLCCSIGLNILGFMKIYQLLNK
jgi:hypothetical protein